MQPYGAPPQTELLLKAKSLLPHSMQYQLEIMHPVELVFGCLEVMQCNTIRSDSQVPQRQLVTLQITVDE